MNTHKIVHHKILRQHISQQERQKRKHLFEVDYLNFYSQENYPCPNSSTTK